MPVEAQYSFEFPRNIWARYARAVRLAEEGDHYAARAILEGVRYHPDNSDAVAAAYRTQLERLAGAAPAKLNKPEDYLGRDGARLLRPFRRLEADRSIPSGYPRHLALPAFAGERNDFRFLRDAAARAGGRRDQTRYRVHVIYAPSDNADIPRVLADLGGLDFDGRLEATIFAGRGAEAGEILRGRPSGFPVKVVPAGLLDDDAGAVIMAIADRADLVLFLSGTPSLDRHLLARALPTASLSDAVVQVLTAQTRTAGMETVFSLQQAKDRFGTWFPHNTMTGPNFAVSGAMLRRVGPPDARFDSLRFSSRELGYRLYNKGVWFVPLIVPQLVEVDDRWENPADHTLYRSLCPDPESRKVGGYFEVPRVSVYIPAYNASKYIERAIDSVLRQDYADLEVCIANDGSTDRTLDLLQRRYGNERRVRWVDNRNGGIGVASNTAIRMSDSLYIGQLDSDDCLKPGAVRKLAEYLDKHTSVVCAYGSCERVDAGGKYIQDEYSWPVFSREKMMITSIAHHFRMFRRQAWERTSHFREDITNAVDYDLFLKLSEVGKFHHVEEKLYQRRWHGENTSNVNEGLQTQNTYLVQREALKRQGLARSWDVDVPDPSKPRNVTYKLHPGRKMLVFWPDYSRSNPYQKLLYRTVREHMEVVAGDIASAIDAVERAETPGDVTFHLHWLNFLLLGAADEAEARERVEGFLGQLSTFVQKGGRLVWTVHNHLSHDTPFSELERELSGRIAEIAHALHFHFASSVEEVAGEFDFPRDKVRIARHGNYVGVYPDYVAPDRAREVLGLAESDDVILFTGAVRPYKGVQSLIEAFRSVLADNPRALLVLAGRHDYDPFADLKTALTAYERARIRVADRFLDDEELQLFFHAADVAVYPYRKVLTTGSVLLALSFGVPVVAPNIGMMEEILAGRTAGALFDRSHKGDQLEDAIREMLARKRDGRMPAMREEARAIADELTWIDFGEIIDE